MTISLKNDTDNTIYYGIDIQAGDAVALQQGEITPINNIDEVLFLKLESYIVPISNNGQQLVLNQQFVEIANSFWTHQVLFQAGLGFWGNEQNNMKVGADEVDI